MAPIPGIAGGIVGTTSGNMQYVGGTTATGELSAVSVPLSGVLTGGIASSPIDGDLVIVAGQQSYFNDRNLSVSGYTELCDIYSNASLDDANLFVGYKRMTATPDTSLSFASNQYNAGYSLAVAVHVWRGVNAVTPIDVTTTTATGTGSLQANPPSITPATGGAIIIAVGGGATRVTSTFSAPQLSNFVQRSASSIANAMIGIGSYRWLGGAFDPNAFSVSTSDSSAAWAAATLALRP